MISKHKKISLATGIPGVALHAAGHFVGEPWIIIVGAILMLGGASHFAQAKKRHLAWSLLGLGSLIGFGILATLKDLTLEDAKRQ